MPVLAGEHPAPQRRPRQDAEPERLGHRDDLALDPALEQRVLHLGGNDGGAAGNCPLPGRGAGRLAAGVVRDAGVTDLAGANGLVDGGESLVHRGHRVPGMQLPQIDMVSAQSHERFVKAAEKVGPRGVEPSLAPGLGAGFRRDDDTVARLELLEELAEHLLGYAIAVDIGGIDQGAAGIEEGSELVASVELVGSAPPRHRPQSKATNPQARSSEGSLLHDGTVLVPEPPWA